MIHQKDSQRRVAESQEGDQVLLRTKHIWLRWCPTKLQRRYVGPFEVIQKTNRAAY